jgi:hypothetical protein
MELKVIGVKRVLIRAKPMLDCINWMLLQHNGLPKQ